MRTCPTCKTVVPAEWARSTCPECDGRLPMPTGRRAPVLSPLTSMARDTAARTRNSDRPPTGNYPSVPPPSGVQRSSSPSMRPGTGRFPSVPPPASEDRWDVDDAGPASSGASDPGAEHGVSSEPFAPATDARASSTPTEAPRGPGPRKERPRDETLSFFGSGSFAPPPRSALAPPSQTKSADAEQTNRLPRGPSGAAALPPVESKVESKAESKVESKPTRVPTIARSEKSGEEVTRGAPMSAAEMMAALAPKPNPSAPGALVDALGPTRPSHEEITTSVPVRAPGSGLRSVDEGAAANDDAGGASMAPDEDAGVRASRRATRPVRPPETQAKPAIPAPRVAEAAPERKAPAPRVNEPPRADLGPATDRVALALVGVALASIWAVWGAGEMLTLGLWGVPGLASLVLAGLPLEARARALLCVAAAGPALALHVEGSVGAAQVTRVVIAAGVVSGVALMSFAAGRVAKVRWGIVLLGAACAVLAVISAGVRAAVVAGALAVLVGIAGSTLATPSDRARA